MNENRVKQIFRNPKNLLKKINRNYPMLFQWMNDEQCIRFWYQYYLGKKADLKNPKTFNEKLQWLKLNNRRPEYTRMADKYEAKHYVAEKIGEEYIIPTLGVWDHFDEINFDQLPDQFVLKCTHDSGGLVICRDKAKLDLAKAKKRIERCLNRNYYLSWREWPYKDIRPRILAEQYMADTTGSDELKDYKFFCFDGQVKCFKIDFDRFVDHHANYYDENGSLLPFGEAAYPPKYDVQLDLPKELEKMKKLASELSKGVPFLRVDFYEADGNVYFGEMTFFPASGFGRFEPEEWDYKLGEWIHLPESACKDI